MNQVTVRSTPFIYSYGVIHWIAQTMIPFRDHKVQAAKLLKAMGLDDDIIEAMLKGQFGYRNINENGDCLISWG